MPLLFILLVMVCSCLILSQNKSSLLLAQNVKMSAQLQLMSSLSRTDWANDSEILWESRRWQLTNSQPKSNCLLCWSGQQAPSSFCGSSRALADLLNPLKCNQCSQIQLQHARLSSLIPLKAKNRLEIEASSLDAHVVKLCFSYS